MSASFTLHAVSGFRRRLYVRRKSGEHRSMHHKGRKKAGTYIYALDAVARKTARKPPYQQGKRSHTMNGKKFYQHLYFQVLTAISIGVCIGHFYPETGAAMKPDRKSTRL